MLTDNKVGNDVSAAIRAYYDACSSLFSNSFRSKMFLLSISYFRLNVDCKTLFTLSSTTFDTFLCKQSIIMQKLVSIHSWENSLSRQRALYFCYVIK